MLKKRNFWIKRIEESWEEKTIVWLSGVRRVGKTTLAQSLPKIEYFDCELPRVRQMMDDPESFLGDLKGRRVVLDEIHRLGNPAQLLKIAADHYPQTKILATGSSTLGVSKKFKDTLTGRKKELWLTPMISFDLHDFGQTVLQHRFLYGGLPPFFLAHSFPEKDFQEWIDSFWAKDIQELFQLEKKYSFQKFVELLMAQSGGIFEATRFSAPCEVSRSTVQNYLKVLEATFVVHVIRPFSSHRPTEIVAAPKVYGFDTGFVCYYRGWNSLRKEDFGFLWEHYILNELQAWNQSQNICYWRDKRGHEVDFILTAPGCAPAAIECKWSASEFDPAGLLAFRKQHREGKNFVVAHDVQKAFRRKYDDIMVNFIGKVWDI